MTDPTSSGDALARLPKPVQDRLERLVRRINRLGDEEAALLMASERDTAHRYLLESRPPQQRIVAVITDVIQLVADVRHPPRHSELDLAKASESPPTGNRCKCGEPISQLDDRLDDLIKAIVDFRDSPGIVRQLRSITSQLKRLDPGHPDAVDALAVAGLYDALGGVVDEVHRVQRTAHER